MYAQTTEYDRQTTYNGQTSNNIRICTNISSVAINIVTYEFIAHYLFFNISTITLGAVDYAASYFKYKTPTPIQGDPTNKTLKRLKQELWANASSVESDLDGGDHGYLGLVLTDAKYSTVTATPFVPPTYLATLKIPTGTDQVQALNLREIHKDAKNLIMSVKTWRKPSKGTCKT